MYRRWSFLVNLNVLVPIVACLLLAAVWGQPLSWTIIALIAVLLIATVQIGVHHAEVVALRVGEPFGTLVLALAVTIIELALIVSIMVSKTSAASLARDTVFATVMIVCNGVVGLCLLVGGLRHRVMEFNVEGTNHALVVLVPLTTLVLVLPAFTTTTPGPFYSTSQLVFAGICSLLLYGVFVFVQTVRHRDYFLPVGGAEDMHAPPPTNAVALSSLLLLVVSLVAVVGLAKKLSPAIEAGVDKMSAPPSVVGIAIALLVLMPETWAALRNALHNRMQTSLNLALGSALATIGLTIPGVAILSISLGLPLELGLRPTETVLLAITLLVSAMSLASGRSTLMHGVVMLVMFAVFLFLAIVP